MDTAHGAISAAVFPPRRSDPQTRPSLHPMAGTGLSGNPPQQPEIYQINMKLLILAPLALGLGLLPTSKTDAAEGVLITLQSVAGRVRSQNLDLAAARLRIDEALGYLRQSGRLDNPELELGLDHDNRFRERTFEIGFSQRFPVTNRLRLEKRVSAAQLQAAEAEIRDAERQLVAAARTALIKVLAIREQRSLRRDQLAIADELTQFTLEASRRGELSPIDAGQAKLEAASLANQSRQLDAAEAAAMGELKPLVGVSHSNTLHVGGNLPGVQLRAPGVDPSNRADWQATRSELEAAENQVGLEHANRYDDIELGLFAAAERSEDAPNGYQDEGVFGFQVKIPLPLWDKNQGNIDAAVARKERKKKELTVLDDDNKPAKIADQSVKLTGGSRTSPTRMKFAKDGDVLVSDIAFPAGNNLPIVLQIKPTADAKSVIEKFTLNLNDCPTCEHKQYSCTCAH